MVKKKTSILLIYTGGTIGMVHNPVNGTLVPFNFDYIVEQVPELNRFDFDIDTYSFNPLIDSSNISPAAWKDIVKIIEANYDKYSGFVILHGTDTMAYSSSALSFMLKNNSKPVIFTGSQLPIGTLRTDGKENLISALEIAAANENGKPIVPEVCVYFENSLFRGNRTTKYSTEHFNAFASPNCEPLAKTGIDIIYNRREILYPTVRQDLIAYYNMDVSVGVLKLFPGISKDLIEAILKLSKLKAVVLESFGAGNAPTDNWFINEIKSYIDSGGIILNVSQCYTGSIKSELYETGQQLVKAGVINGKDITTESALTKLMYLLGNYDNNDEIKKMLKNPIIGEIKP
jgi:L-asparaginase